MRKKRMRSEAVFVQKFEGGQRWMGVRCTKCGIEIAMWPWKKYADGWLNKEKVLRISKGFVENHICRRRGG